MNNIKFRKISRNQLFYDQWQYCLGFYIAEATALRNLDPEQINNVLDKRIEWRAQTERRWEKFYGKNKPHSWSKITDQTRENLQEVGKFLLNSGCAYKLVVSYNQANVYSNDLDFLARLDKIKILKSKSYRQVLVDIPKNTILIKSSLYKYRSFLTRVKLSNNEKLLIKNFFDNQQESIKIAPALKIFLSNSVAWTQDYYFIDHNEKSWLTMINLVRPGLIRKTVEIITGK